MRPAFPGWSADAAAPAGFQAGGGLPEGAGAARKALDRIFQNLAGAIRLPCHHQGPQQAAVRVMGVRRRLHRPAVGPGQVHPGFEPPGSAASHAEDRQPPARVPAADLSVPRLSQACQWVESSWTARGSGLGGLPGDAPAVSGIDFDHVKGSAGDYFLIETMAAGGGGADFDGDGHLDLYLVKRIRSRRNPTPD